MQLAHDVNTSLERPAEAFFVVARTGEGKNRSIVGCIRATIEREADGLLVCSFGPFAVAPTHQGRGIGGALMKAIDALSCAAGAEAIRCSVVNVREDVLTLYKKMGFVEIGTSPFSTDLGSGELTREVHFIELSKPLK